jgi:hypothetical protein
MEQRDIFLQHLGVAPYGADNIEQVVVHIRRGCIE